MLRTSIVALGLTALLAACGGQPGPSVTGLTVLNKDASNVTPLCPGGIDATVTIQGQNISNTSKVNPGTIGTADYTPAFINQIKKGQTITVQATCYNADGTSYSKKTVTGTLREDYQDKGSDYSVTVNGTAATVGGFSTCRATDFPLRIAPCIVGGAALGLNAP